MGADRVTRLGQAVQVGDLLADRTVQLLEQLEPFLGQLTLGQLEQLEAEQLEQLLVATQRLRQLARNLRTSAGSYLELRQP